MKTCGSIAPRPGHTVGAVVVSTKGPYGVLDRASEMHIFVPGAPATWTAYASTKVRGATLVTDGAHGPVAERNRPSAGCFAAGWAHDATRIMASPVGLSGVAGRVTQWWRSVEVVIGRFTPPLVVDHA